MQGVPESSGIVRWVAIAKGAGHQQHACGFSQVVEFGLVHGLQTSTLTGAAQAMGTGLRQSFAVAGLRSPEHQPFRGAGYQCLSADDLNRLG
ncbi:hypothetical protein D3C80_1384140 [compost metagenome]